MIDRLDVEHVLRRRDAGAERARRRVRAGCAPAGRPVERARPDAAGQARPAALLHDLEQHGLLAAVGARGARGTPSRRGRRRPPCSRGARSRTAAPSDAHDDVADLARRVAPDPGLAVEHDAAADAGAPEDAEQRACTAGRSRARTRRRSPPGRRCRARPARRRPSRARAAGRSCRPSPGRFLAPATVPVSSSTLPGEPMPMPASAEVFDAGLAGRVLERAGDLGRYAGGTAGRGRRAARLAGDLAGFVDDDRLDLGSAEVDSAGVSHVEGVPDRNVSCVTGSIRSGISVTVIASICSLRRRPQRDIPERAGTAGGGAQVAVGHVGLELAEPAVKPHAVEHVEARGDPVADPREGGDVAAQRGAPAGVGVAPRTPGPQLEPLAVDLVPAAGTGAADRAPRPRRRLRRLLAARGSSAAPAVAARRRGRRATCRASERTRGAGRARHGGAPSARPASAW